EGFHSNASINFDYISPPLYSTEQLYKYVYFNEMNLAVKSSRSSRRSPSPSHHISPEAMRIIIDLNREYNELDEGETIMRTLSDFWVVCRKSGHRRFFVILTQKNANFAEINEEVRKLCQREFTNIFFLD
ncbi:Vacuolar fusion protein CCZ1 homolog, partial [Geodia barretti]